MIKQNQEEYLFCLFPSTQACLLTSSDDFLLRSLLKAIRISSNIAGSFEPCYMCGLAS